MWPVLLSLADRPCAHIRLLVRYHRHSGRHLVAQEGQEAAQEGHKVLGAPDVAWRGVGIGKEEEMRCDWGTALQQCCNAMQASF